MNGPRRPIGLGLMLGIALAMGMAAVGHAQDEVSACYDRYAWGGSQVLLGTALPDSVVVPSGARFSIRPPPSGTTLYGQLFLLEQANPPVTGDTVILTRWWPTTRSPTYWENRSPLWMQPGEQLMIYADVRTRDDWSRLPTFDVRYIGPTSPRRMGNPGMTAEEAFAFCALRVDLEAVNRGDWSEDIAPMAWARSSNGAWREWPAVAYLSKWARDVEAARVTRLRPDVAGTWQLTASLPSGSTRQMFFRTDDRAHAPWDYSSPLGLPLDSSPWEHRTDGYRVGMWMAEEINDLPTTYDRGILPCRSTRAAVSAITGRSRPPAVASECVSARWAWYVDFEDPNRPERRGLWSPHNLADIFVEDDEVQALIDAWIWWWEEVVGQPTEYPDPGSFSGAGPDLTYRAAVQLPDGSSMLIQAVRVSEEVAEPR